eukprot:2239212-Ditylum_brightwellii.AAC.1
MKAMKCIMRYCVFTKKRGLVLKPDVQWNGRKGFKFRIKGYSDSEYSKDKSRCSVNRWSVFMCNAPISYKSKMMPIVALFVTEVELFAAILCIQDMLFAMRVPNAMQLQVELPMTLFIDNKGATDLCNNWSIGGRTRH